MKTKLSVSDFQRLKKQNRKWTWVICYDYAMASVVEESETEMLLVGDSMGSVILRTQEPTPISLDMMIAHVKAAVAGAPNTFVIGDIPDGTYKTEKMAVETAKRLMEEGGCDAVKLEGGMDVVPFVSAITKAGIPVLAHIGYTPQTKTAAMEGNAKKEADRLVAEAQALADAGAFGIGLVKIPAVVARRITETIPIPTLGLAAGPYCDAQELHLYDLTGLVGETAPFVKRYANVRADMVSALNAFHTDTLSLEFPSLKYSDNISIEGY